jgi:hypothetical protein
MSTSVPWVTPATSAGAPAPASAPVRDDSVNLGTLLVFAIVAGAIVQWIAGRQRAQQEADLAKTLETRVDEAHFELEGAREDEQLRLAHAFAARPAVPGIGWGR